MVEPHHNGDGREGGGVEAEATGIGQAADVSDDGPEHRASHKYCILVLADLKGDPTDVKRVERKTYQSKHQKWRNKRHTGRMCVPHVASRRGGQPAACDYRV